MRGRRELLWALTSFQTWLDSAYGRWPRCNFTRRNTLLLLGSPVIDFNFSLALTIESNRSIHLCWSDHRIWGICLLLGLILEYRSLGDHSLSCGLFPGFWSFLQRYWVRPPGRALSGSGSKRQVENEGKRKSCLRSIQILLEYLSIVNPLNTMTVLTMRREQGPSSM